MASLRFVSRLALALGLALAFAAASLLPRPALADDASILTWVAPATCPSEADVSRQIRGAIGSGVAMPASLRARALVEEVRGAWRSDLELSVGGQSSVRHVEGETCRAVADAVAVIIALAVSPEVETPPPRALPPPAPAPPPPHPVEPPPRPPMRPYDFGATFVLDAGTLPSVAYGAEAVGGWRTSRLELEIAARFLAPETDTLAPPSAIANQGSTFWLAGAGARGCYAVVTGTFDVAPCAGIHGEWLIAQGVHTLTKQGAAIATGVVSLGGRVTVRLTGRLALRVGVEVLAPLVRTDFEIQDAAGGDVPVYRRSAAAGRAFVGPLVTF